MQQKYDEADIATIAANVLSHKEQMNRIEDLIKEVVKTQREFSVSTVGKEDYSRDMEAIQKTIKSVADDLNVTKLSMQQQYMKIQILINDFVMKFTQQMYNINIKMATYSGAAGVIIWLVQYVMTKAL